jgi:hypothetical protein
MMEWILVTDKKPEKAGFVLVLMRRSKNSVWEVGIKYYRKKRKTNMPRSYPFSTTSEVKYWCPLPMFPNNEPDRHSYIYPDADKE